MALAALAWIIAGLPMVNPDLIRANTLYNAALLELKTDNSAGALGYLRDSVRHNPAHAPAQRELGRLLLLEGNREEALEHFRIALRAFPDDPDTHRILGGLYQEEGRLDASFAHLVTVIRLEPDFEPTWDQAAWLFHRHPDPGALDRIGKRVMGEEAWKTLKARLLEKELEGRGGNQVDGESPAHVPGEGEVFGHP
ncbi:MAG: tetratricopeptide repeat protein [Proteobacteria bacterium]|nr:tetratricopeptide repeat protein [Pseudomonadota bacterium]